MVEQTLGVLMVVIGCAGIAFEIALHLKQRRQGRLPGQRWCRAQQKWVDL
jgi:hypothetical protein